jgi:hypothetical protein
MSKETTHPKYQFQLNVITIVIVFLICNTNQNIFKNSKSQKYTKTSHFLFSKFKVKVIFDETRIITILTVESLRFHQ